MQVLKSVQSHSILTFLLQLLPNICSCSFIFICISPYINIILVPYETFNILDTAYMVDNDGRRGELVYLCFFLSSSEIFLSMYSKPSQVD